MHVEFVDCNHVHIDDTHENAAQGNKPNADGIADMRS